MLRDRVLSALAPRRTVHAHCDVPCGIYDPHGAELAAKTVSRMVVLINEKLGSDIEQRNKLIRQNWQTVELPFCPSIFESDISAVFVAQLAKAFPQRASLSR